jgi:DNA processing protein
MRRLYTRGTIPTGGIAIVGSRTPPPEAAEFAFALAARLARPVVAGLALGIDTAAHRGALSAGIPTVAFVPYGFGCTYPPENAALERAIVEAGGAIATLRAPGEGAVPESFVERDRLQAEYAIAVVLIASEAGGGALQTLEFARELGRPRFALRPSGSLEGRPEWAGNLRALAGGAHPLPFDLTEAIRNLNDRLDGA